MEELEKYLRALVLLQLDAVVEEGEPTNPAVLLSRAGFTNAEIGLLLDKTSDSVKKAVLRANRKAPVGR